MEEYYIGKDGLEKRDGTEVPNSGVLGFRLLWLAIAEWDHLPVLGLTAGIRLEKDWLDKLRPVHLPGDRSGVKEGYLGFNPRVDHLKPGIHFVCYRDLDDQGNELAVYFFLTPEAFILVNKDAVTREQLSGWVARGLLATPLDLAQLLGVRVLSHHQSRLEKIDDQMEHIEEAILKGPRVWQQTRIILLHRRVIGLKKSLNLHQSVFTKLSNLEQSDQRALWQELVLDTERELDNVRQAHELVESLREAYQAAVDNRSNDIMKLLTLLATILLPINLATSFFGMNFENMPLIHQAYGIVVFYAISALVAIVAIWYFWRKHWLH